MRWWTRRSVRGNDDRAMTGFSPLQIPDLAYWWRADLGVTLEASNVSEWACQKTGISLTAAGGDRPMFAASVAALANRPALEFRTNSMQANNGAAAWKLLHDGTGFEAWMALVARSTAGAVNQIRWSTITGYGATNIGAQSGFDDTNPNDESRFTVVRGATGRVVNELSSLSAGTLRNTFRVLRQSYGTAFSPQFENHMDGTLIGSGPEINPPSASDPQGPLTLGSSQNGSTSGAFDCAEFCVFSAQLSAGYRTSMLAYMTGRYV